MGFPQGVQTSPLASRLVGHLRPNRFRLLRTGLSPPVAPHPASRRRSYLRLPGRRAHAWRGLTPLYVCARGRTSPGIHARAFLARRRYTPPMRIVSLVPNGTEILFALGAGDLVVGVSHECDYPAEARTRPILTGSALAQPASPAPLRPALVGWTSPLPYPTGETWSSAFTACPPR